MSLEFGTAPERTRLSYRRTALAMTAVAVLTVRLALRHGYTPVHLAIGILAVLGWLVLLIGCQRRIAAVRDCRTAEERWVLAGAALGIVWFSVLGACLVVLP